MDKRVRSALSEPPDYSEEFTNRMERLRSKIEEELNISVDLDTDMNYAVSNSLIVYLDGKDYPVDKNSATAIKMAIFLVSSRANFYTVAARTQVGSQYWDLSPPEAVRELVSRVSCIFEEAGLEELKGSVLSEIVPGHLTELDSEPATVFQVLFAELF